jgi:hypothetical protein
MRLSYLAAVPAILCLAQTPQPGMPGLRIPYPHLSAYFGLEPAQQLKIVEVNARFQRYLAEKTRRAAQVQHEIQRELEQRVPAPMALGLRVAEIEAICREAVETRAKAIADVQGVLNAAQKQKFDLLRQALALLPTIREAQGANLLPREIPGYKPPAPLREPEFGVLEWGVVSQIGPAGLPGCRASGPAPAAVQPPVLSEAEPGAGQP